ncbi:lipoyl(octanoyl) transferase LipB [Granulibacter bethesdensis]|nr:lipoyl(octanoyl) transferase LipB [Granulibacter bethesdensis]
MSDPRLFSSSGENLSAVSPEADPVEWRVTPGLTPYQEALTAMRTRAEAIHRGEARSLVWLVEHPPLYTAGTSAKIEDLRDPARFPTFEAGRGGQWTYHGPGQRIAYVMLDLNHPHGIVPARDLRAYIAALEDWIISTLARFGIIGERRAGRVGIWVQRGQGEKQREDKIAAIGVRITRWISWHGIAINVAPDLEHFTGIVPCGISEHGVTSLADLGIQADMGSLDAALRTSWSSVFGGSPIQA